MQNTEEDEEKMPSATSPEDIKYDFGVGHPASSLNLGKELIRKCMTKHTDPENTKYYTDSTGYGSDEGSWYFRGNFADWINKLNALNKDEDDKKYEAVYGSNMVVTTGASHSMELLLTHLKRLKKKTNKNCQNIVLLEDPSYFLFPNIAEIVDCKLLPIPFVNNVLDFEFMENMLNKYGNDIICLYIIPNYQNPLGISYEIRDKIRLIQLCHKHRLHVIADEVYNLLSFDDDKMVIPFMASIEQTVFGNKEEQSTFYCHSISSFSKIIGPGFRTGWIYSANEQILQLIASHGTIKSGGCMSHFVPSLLAHLLDVNNDDDINDMTEHLMKVRHALAANCKALCETIRKYDTKKMIRFTEPKGGYFMWLELPEDKMSIISDESAKVTFFQGLKLSASFGPISKDIQFVPNVENEERRKYFGTCVRFCFAYLSEQEIRDGAQLFVESIYK